MSSDRQQHRPKVNDRKSTDVFHKSTDAIAANVQDSADHPSKTAMWSELKAGRNNYIRCNPPKLCVPDIAVRPPQVLALFTDRMRPSRRPPLSLPVAKTTLVVTALWLPSGFAARHSATGADGAREFANYSSLVLRAGVNFSSRRNHSTSVSRQLICIDPQRNH